LTLDLSKLLAAESFRPLDRYFARFLLRLAESGEPALGLAAALVSRQTGQGHVCLDLATVAGRPLGEVIPDGGEEGDCPELSAWEEILRASGVVAAPGEFAPLVLAGSRLYLHRYWEYEKEVADALLARAGDQPPVPKQEKLAANLDRLFPGPHKATDRQRAAAAVSALRRLCVISGGPGSGKTHTVVRIMALLQELAAPDFLRIGLAAPTGKAAARLQEAVRRAGDQLDLPPGLSAAIPTEAATIHRLLGVRRGSPRFRHHRDHPLPLDLLIVDEASMVDLALMAKLLAALPAVARLVLLGDKDQLASVEAGAVLGDICGDRAESGMPAALAGLGFEGVATEDKGGPLADCLMLLSDSYRFGPESGIGRLARAVNAGDADGALVCLRDEALADVEWRSAGEERALANRVVAGFQPYLKAASPEGAFAAFEGFRLLTGLRQGRIGSVGLNEWVERQLARAGLIALRREDQWYKGRPVMIARNHYALGLYNGDIGLTLPDREGRLRVFFPAADGSLRSIAPTRMPEHETAYALTVHKSQGSEFDEVLLLLPDQPSPVISRELLYTAVTRAKSRFELWGGEEVFRAAVIKRTTRGSGLRELLWN
jgi:exodeoxyribonuclease V alpha subunit